MSGPQMIGVVLLHCKVDLRGGINECRSVDHKLPGVPTRDLGSEPRRVWVSMQAMAYTSTGKDSGSNTYEAFKSYMFGLDSTLEMRSGTYKGWTFYHGVAGVSYNYLFGNGFPRFDKVGLKSRPVAATYKRLDISATVRVYPNGFGSDEFGFAPRLGQVDRPREALYGFSAGLAW